MVSSPRKSDPAMVMRRRKYKWQLATCCIHILLDNIETSKLQVKLESLELQIQRDNTYLRFSSRINKTRFEDDVHLEADHKGIRGFPTIPSLLGKKSM